MEIEVEFYKNLAKAAPEKTIFVSDSSTMLPNVFAHHTERPEKYLHLHFVNEIWINNLAEIMKHEGTDLHIFEEIIEFAKAIGMVLIPIYKEQPDYVLNTLLVSFFFPLKDMLLNKDIYLQIKH